MSASAFRQVVQDQLADEFSIQFVSGELPEGPNPVGERDVGCCWVDTIAQSGDTPLAHDVNVNARLYKRWVPPDNPIEYDTTELEDLAERFFTSLATIQASAETRATGVWFFKLTAVQVRQDLWGVEGTIVAYRSDTFAAGG